MPITLLDCVTSDKRATAMSLHLKKGEQMHLEIKWELR